MIYHVPLVEVNRTACKHSALLSIYPKTHLCTLLQVKVKKEMQSKTKEEKDNYYKYFYFASLLSSPPAELTQRLTNSFPNGSGVLVILPIVWI